jgi:DNA replicative helicase MCM subunit Mcm2 (Cdc46/Mcm family)
MSFPRTDTSSDSDERTDVDLAKLKERIEDLEVEVYGYDRSDDLSAGEEVVVNLKQTVVFLENQHRRRTDENERYAGAPIEQVYDIAGVLGMDRDLAKQAYEKLRRQGEVYEPTSGTVRATSGDP